MTTPLVAASARHGAADLDNSGPTLGASGWRPIGPRVGDAFVALLRGLCPGTAGVYGPRARHWSESPDDRRGVLRARLRERRLVRARQRAVAARALRDPRLRPPRPARRPQPGERTAPRAAPHSR